MKTKKMPALFGIGIILLLGFTLSALTSCGDAQTVTNGSTNGGQTPTAQTSPAASPTTSTPTVASPTTVANTPTAGSSTAVATPTSPAALGQLCGTVAQMPTGEPRDPVRSQLAGNCFWQAFNLCHPASLIFTAGGVDTLTTHTFTIVRQQTGCVTSDTVQHRIMPRPAGPAQVYTCAHTSKNGSNLVFQNCGTDGNITIPLQ